MNFLKTNHHVRIWSSFGLGLGTSLGLVQYMDRPLWGRRSKGPSAVGTSNAILHMGLGAAVGVVAGPLVVFAPYLLTDK